MEVTEMFDHLETYLYHLDTYGSHVEEWELVL